MKLNEAVVVPAITKQQPTLKDNQTVRVYHGTSEPEVVITALTRGISGGSPVVRKYSYEANNNPRGLFVSPDLRTAKEFGSYILEFHTRVSDLEAPVWPGGSFTVQGGMAGTFSDAQERELERMRQREHWSQAEYEYVRNSDRPEMAALFLAAGERQALFTGDLNKNSIRAVWMSKDPSRVGQQYVRMSPKEFIDKFNREGIPTSYGTHTRDEKDSEFTRTVKRRIIEPRDDVSGDEFIDAMISSTRIKMPREQVAQILKDNPEYIRDRVWSERQYRRILSDLQRNY